MSNLLCIEIIESRTAGTTDPFEFSVVATDSYGTAINKGFSSMGVLMEEFPTRMDLLRWVGEQVQFDGAFTCEGTEVILDSTSDIQFAGFPEDDSITAMMHEDDVVERLLKETD